MAFARYNVLQDAGHALGVPALLQQTGLIAGDDAFRGSVIVYAALLLAPAAAYFRLWSAVESPSLVRRPWLPCHQAHPLAAHFSVRH